MHRQFSHYQVVIYDHSPYKLISLANEKDNDHSLYLYFYLTTEGFQRFIEMFADHSICYHVIDENEIRLILKNETNKEIDELFRRLITLDKQIEPLRHLIKTKLGIETSDSEKSRIESHFSVSFSEGLRETVVAYEQGYEEVALTTLKEKLHSPAYSLNDMYSSLKRYLPVEIRNSIYNYLEKKAEEASITIINLTEKSAAQATVIEQFAKEAEAQQNEIQQLKIQNQALKDEIQHLKTNADTPPPSTLFLYLLSLFTTAKESARSYLPFQLFSPTHANLTSESKEPNRLPKP